MEALEQLRENIQRVFLGHTDTVDRALVCLLARGHLLIEDVPGVGKTVLANALSRSIACNFSRIQLTPDLLPTDILGVTVWNQQEQEFVFTPGPIFANIVLADEVNRTTPRTQSALLEAMNEGQVSVDGRTRRLEQPFLVIATQNPLEFEGTYFLPESQLDRFLMRISVGYPSAEDEARILELDPSRTSLNDLEPVMSAEQLVELQRLAPKVRVDSEITAYVVRIAEATREQDQLRVGLSTRGALALYHAARATALLNDRDYVIPEDVTANIVPVCAHRIIARSYLHDSEGQTTAQIMQQIAETTPSPE